MDQIDISSYLQMGTDAVITYAPKVLIALVVLFIGLKIIKVLQKLIEKACLKSNIDAALRSFFHSLSGWVLKILLFVAVADMMGIATTSFIAIIGAAGLAVGLALQGTLANFAGGVLILIFKPFKIGDLVNSQGVTGTVKSIQIFNTILLTPENKTVIMPNGSVMNNHITNFTEEGTIRVDLTVGISYSADIKKAKEVLEATVAQDARVLTSPKPTIAVSELGDSSVNLAVRPWCSPEVYWDVYFDTLENCKIALDKEGIGIPFPQRDVHIYNHN